MSTPLSRRDMLRGAAGFASLSALPASVLSRSALAQAAYPNRTLTYIVPFSPGGSTDFVARLLAEQITAQTKQQVIVDYKIGASGVIAANHLVRSTQPDGYTLFGGTNNYFTTLPRMQKIEYDPNKDLIPVAMTGDAFMPLAVNPSLPVKNLQDLIAYAKANPGRLVWASSGVGSTNHLSYHYFRSRTGTNIKHISYRGATEAFTALLGNEVHIVADTGSTEFILDGKMRGIAILGKNRWDRLPDVPTVEEAGLPDWRLRSWHTVMVKGGTSREICTTLNTMINGFLAQPAIRTKLRGFGLDPAVVSLDDLAERIRADRETFGPVIEVALNEK